MHSPCTDRRERDHHPDYEARAIQAEDQAERSVTREMADGWRRLAESYWMLARQVARVTSVNVVWISGVAEVPIGRSTLVDLRAKDGTFDGAAAAIVAVKPCAFGAPLRGFGA